MTPGHVLVLDGIARLSRDRLDGWYDRPEFVWTMQQLADLAVSWQEQHAELERLRAVVASLEAAP